MQNSSKQSRTISASVDIEIIQPADGHGETSYFFIICAGVILLSGILLSLIYSPTHVVLAELPVEHSNFATQISNALEEISLLEEVSMISAPYDIKQLPFPQYGETTFTQQGDHCFTLQKAGMLFSVEREQSGWIAHWAKSDTQLDCHAALKWHQLNR